MASIKVRRRVIEKERRIKRLRDEGWTCAEIAVELGVSTQRVYDFLSQARRRQPVLSPADRLHRDEEVRRRLATKKLCVPGNQKQFANVALDRLEELLLAFEFTTLSVGDDVTQVQITKSLRRPTPRPGVDEALAKLRLSIAEAKRVTLLRYREYGPDGQRIKWQVWTFVFLKSN
jgi:transposase